MGKVIVWRKMTEEEKAAAKAEEIEELRRVYPWNYDSILNRFKKGIDYLSEEIQEDNDVLTMTGYHVYTMIYTDLLKLLKKYSDGKAKIVAEITRQHELPLDQVECDCFEGGPHNNFFDVEEMEDEDQYQMAVEIDEDADYVI